MPKSWALGAALAASIGCSSVCAQTIPEEYAKLIQEHSRIGTLDGGFFGDHVSLSTGSLEIVQTDVSLPGNDALAVRAGRRFEPGSWPARGQFADWDLDIPHLHGIYANEPGMAGWLVEGTDPDHRCTEFNMPPIVATPPSDGAFDPSEYWQGSFLYLPGGGDQELLAGGDVPATGGPYPATTQQGAIVRCLPALASTSTAGSSGEGFEVVTPDGTIYRFDQMVNRYASGLTKSDPVPMLRASDGSRNRTRFGRLPPGSRGIAASPNAPTPGSYTLDRVEVFIYPTLVTDRFGNSVTYAWDSSNPWRLLSIHSSDGRSLTFGYSSSDPTSNLVQSVSDGVHTWNYTYSGTVPDVRLATVTQPDLQAWQFNLEALKREAKPHPQGITCDTLSLGGSPWSGSITAPSGATVQYTLAQKMFGRSWAFRDCKVSSEGAESIIEPYLFVSVAIIGKTITGPGLPTGGLSWNYAYGLPNNCWDPSGIPAGDPDAVICTENSPTSRTTTVTAPDLTTSRYTFGNKVGDWTHVGNEGLLRVEEQGVSGTTALRTTTMEYGDGNAPPYGSHQGNSLRRRGDWIITGQRRPQRNVVVTQQGVNFSWSVPQDCGGTYCLDTRARPTKVVRSGPGASRTETTTYYDNTPLWVLGQVAQVTCVAPCSAPGTVMSATTFDSGNALPLTISAFGKLKNIFTYDTTSPVNTGQRGTLLTAADGKGNTTTYSNWKRGIPQTVAFADSTSRTAVVRDEGWISSVTDENLYTTSYSYDAMGRITQVTYPTSDSVAWASTTSAFGPVGSVENGIAAGHWRETVHTGNGYKVTLFDALWRPVLVHEYDSNVAGSDRYMATAYDKAGRVVDASYPLGAAGSALALDSNAGWHFGTGRPDGVRTGYDALGRQASVQQDSELGVLTTTTDYLNGFQRRVTDARGNATTEWFMAWDSPSFDLPVRIDAPEHQRTTITRDPFGKPTAITRTEVAP